MPLSVTVSHSNSCISAHFWTQKDYEIVCSQLEQDIYIADSNDQLLNLIREGSLCRQCDDKTGTTCTTVTRY